MNTSIIGPENENVRAGGGHDMALMCEYMAHAMKKSSQQRMLSRLPIDVRKRVRALRKLQLKTTNLEAEFHRRVYELEKQHQASHDSLFSTRKSIINGTYEPTEEECDYPDANIEQSIQYLSVNVAGNDDVPAGQPGIPHFWLNIFKYVPMFESMVKDVDEPLLKHLIDIRVKMNSAPEMSFTLEFEFSANEYFEDKILTKEYFMKCEPDAEAPFTFDGPEIYKSKGCPIKWKDGKNLTLKTVKQKSPERGPPKMMKAETFFNFFSPPVLPEDQSHEDYDDINTALETDFEIGHYLKERIIPRAILYYTGENDDEFDSDGSTVYSTEMSDEEEAERAASGIPMNDPMSANDNEISQ